MRNAVAPAAATCNQHPTLEFYEYVHVVGLEDTNITGNVYFLNHLKWQGRCRELFLAERAPEVFSDLKNGLCLLTLRAACDYRAELFALDTVVVRMFLKELSPTKMTLGFDYWRHNHAAHQLVATGEQEIMCMRRSLGTLIPAAIPTTLVTALSDYRGQRL